jgi:epoxyqueuosine reductase
MNAEELTRRLKAEALRLGFDRVGVAPAVSAPGHGMFTEWLQAGHAADMAYMAKHAAARAHPESILEGVRSVVMTSVVYGSPGRAPGRSTEGKVARYARGVDYHRLLWDRLGTLLGWLEAEQPGVRGRAVVDTAPLLERDFARLAGLGWIGKNSMLIDRKLGSFTFLGALLVDCDLTPDVPHEASHCGTCTRCLDACPTDAFAGPYQLDARRCISYWTIEHRGPIPEAFRDRLHGWVFGCDVCQDVCPWNHKAPSGHQPELDARPEWSNPELIEWLDRDRANWSAMLKDTALRRTRREGLLRNAALVLGTRGVPEAVPALQRRRGDAEEDSSVREAAAWALGRIAQASSCGARGEAQGVVDRPAPEDAENE